MLFEKEKKKTHALNCSNCNFQIYSAIMKYLIRKSFSYIKKENENSTKLESADAVMCRSKNYQP